MPSIAIADDDDDSRLRITRTQTESLHEAAREDARRKVGKRRRRDTIKETLRGRRPLFGRSPSKASRPTTADSRLSTADTVSRPDEDDVLASPTRRTAAASPTTLHDDDGEELVGPQLPSIARTPTSLGVEEQQAKAEGFVGGSGEAETTRKKADAKAAAETRRRRNVWLNHPLPATEIDRHGQPLARWARNKVRTSKYTLLSFLPKELSEQFRRAANIYFLILVVLQVFPMFGAAAPQIAMLPLCAVLTITAIKDGVEDYRRHALDNQVNDSAVTRLGKWRNVNLATHDTSLWQRIIRLGRPVHDPRIHVSRGVRKLREKEGAFSTDFLYSSTTALTKPETTDASSMAATDEVESIAYLDAYSNSSHGDGLSSLPMNRTRSNTSASSINPSINAESFRSQGGVHGVIDYSRPASTTGAWERTLFKKLNVGDVILLSDDDVVPADLVILSTSDPDGICWVETKNLDGETNLKPRRALKASMGIQSEEDVEHSRFVIDSEPPHANLYSYNAVLRYPVTGKAATGSVDQWAKEPVSIQETLLRGCNLRNTTWVIGIVVYTGAETKIMLNQGDTPSKRSKIEKETNYNVLANFSLLVLTCTLCAILTSVAFARLASSDFYEPNTIVANSPALESVVTFAACLILFQNIVPISLVISVELVKSIQAYFIFLDAAMYWEPLDHPCVPKTWNISDDLGQIAYIFSDKTGTLTQNVMEFQRCSVGGLAYGEGITESMVGAAKREGRDLSALDPAQNGSTLQVARESMIEAMQRLYKNRWLQTNKLTLVSPQLVHDLADRSSEQRRRLIDFFRALAICHTVLADRSDAPSIDYKAESPDEAALSAGARDLGFVFLSRSVSSIELEVMGQPERWAPLRVLEFNSTRKRMSIIVRAPDGRIHLITKGADSVIYQRLRSDHDQESKQAMTRDLEDFATGGLRTLCVGSRILGEEEFTDWARTYDAACSSIEDDREDQIEKACELIEHNLTLLGATGLEDKLQVGVPDAIQQLHLAGIRLWILTGDKLQTAIEISFACNVLQPSFEIFILSSETLEGARSQVEAGLDQIQKARTRGDLSQQFAVVIDGDTLRYALDASIKALFLELTTQCETVVCCRVSPAQKAQTVRLVKEGRGAMTLAIGDGANDVAMIQAAHVGVGIAGLEGAQAAMSADYAIGQFKFLTRLLLVHGRWSYLRVAGMHALFFFKSMSWTFASALIQPFADWDATYLFSYSLILGYSLIFTSLPVAVLGAFEQDVPAEASLAYPALYKRGILGLEYTKSIFWAYMADGVYQGTIVFVFPFFVYRSITSNSSGGYDAALPDLGTTVAVSAVLAANVFVGLNIRAWTWLVFAAVFGSSLVAFLWIIVLSVVPGQDLFHTIQTLFSTPTFWLLVLLTQVVALGPRYVYKYIREQYAPTDVDIVRERVVLLKESYGDEESTLRSLPPTSRAVDRSPPLADMPMTELEPRRAEPYNPLARTASEVTMATTREAVTAPSSPQAAQEPRTLSSRLDPPPSA